MAWFGRRNGRHRVISSASAKLSAGAEAFLSGDYANHLRRQCEPVPAWAQQNALAHRDLESLRRTRQEASAVKRVTRSSSREDQAWMGALRFLMAELLEVVGDSAEALAQLQRGVLVPLELQLICQDKLTVSEVVRCTEAALRSSIR